jgi:hypothetical protein
VEQVDDALHVLSHDLISWLLACLDASLVGRGPRAGARAAQPAPQARTLAAGWGGLGWGDQAGPPPVSTGRCSGEPGITAGVAACRPALAVRWRGRAMPPLEPIWVVFVLVVLVGSVVLAMRAFRRRRR